MIKENVSNKGNPEELGQSSRTADAHTDDTQPADELKDCRAEMARLNTELLEQRNEMDALIGLSLRQFLYPAILNARPSEPTRPPE
jgi:hypothetical protein